MKPLSSSRLQREIDRGPENSAPGVLAELVDNRHAIALRAEAEDREEHQVFEFAEQARQVMLILYINMTKSRNDTRARLARAARSAGVGNFT